MSTENPQQAQNPTLPVNPLTQEQLVVIKDLFTECDTNKDGVIDREELRSSIHKFVFNQSEQVTDEQLDILMKRLDTKDRGVVNFDDFVAGIMPLLAPKEKGRSLSKEQEDQMKSLFSSLERDENGRLDVNEIKGVLLTIFSIAQKHVTADQLEQLSHYVSKEEDDKDTVIETIQLFISTGVLQVPPGTKERTIRGTSVALLKQYRRKMDEIEVSRSNSGSRNNSIIKNEMQELTSIMNEKTALEEQLRRLREEGQHLREVNNGLLDKVAKLEDENKEFKKRSKALEKVRDSNKELQEQIDAMKIELDELRRTQKETKKYQIRYSQENEDLQKKLSEKEKMLQNSKTEVLSMAQQLQQIKAVERPSSPKPVLQRLSASANHEQDEAAKIINELNVVRKRSEEMIHAKEEEIRSLLIKIEQLTKANRETQDMLESANSNISKLKASLEEHQIETAKSTTHKELPPESFLLELAHEIQSPSPSRSITPGLGGPPQWPLQNAPPPSVFPPSIIRSEYQAKQMQNVSQGKKAPIKISQQSTMVKYQRTSMADAQPKQKAKGSKPQNQNQKQPEQQQANASEQKQQKQPKPKNENKKADAENKKPEQVNKEQANNKENSKQEKPQVPPSKEEVQAPASTEPQANNNNNSNPSQPQTNAKEKKPKAPKKEAVTGRGQVKAVPSGDTVVVIHLEKNRPPVERKITLSNIRAPKLGLRTFTEKKEDEDFAWQSREFLRKLTIEKPVSYTIEGTSKDGSRDFGLVHLIDKEGKTQDIAALIVAEGWAEVTTKTGENNTSNRPDVEELNRLEEIAKRDNKGQWNKNTKKDKKRPIVEINNIPEVYERLKGHPQHGIVENVINGNTVILTITPQFYDIKLNLSGVECPGYDDYGAWEPFGREARFTTEFLLLHRDVQVIFEGADKFNLYGSLNYHGRNISEELLRRGLAKFVDWSGNKTAFRDKLKAAEKQAVEQKAGIWSTAQPSAKVEDKKGWKPGKEVHGKVVEVVSAGVIVVEDNKNRHRINLSSIRALRGGSLVFSKDEEKREEGKAQEKSEKELQKEKRHRAEFLEKTYAHEGKEYLRKRLIGQKVRCVLDYSRPPLPSNENKEEKGKKEEDKLYWSVYFEKNNVAVEIVANGFARATEHRAGDLRSKDYEDILKAENLATKSHRGIHTPDEKAAITYISDATSDATKARKFLASLKRSKQRGVVEYVAHASRFKLYVPKESCEMFINIAGIKTPRTPKEKFFQESLDFIKEKLFQRDVEFEVVNVDKGGSFLGTIWFNRENIATSLLSQGFATIIKAVARDSEYFNDYRAAEDAAKRNRKHLWEDYDEEAEKAAAQKRRQDYESEKKKAEVVDVIVTEIIDATKFYVQIVGKEAEKLEEVMKQLAAQDPATEPYSSKFGDIVAAQFTADDAWYRAKNNGETPDGQVKVFYIDYGNSEVIPKSRVRKLPEDFDIKKLPPQAFEAHLAYVKPPALNQEYGQEAAEFFKELVEGKTLYASIEFRDGNTLYLTMGDNAQLFVNAAIVRAGLARVERVKGAREAMAKLKAEEEKARLSHNYIWEYGDPGSDEEDQPLRPSAKQAKAPPKKKAEEPKKEGKEEKKESE